jgi:Rrf2 family protein
MKFSTKAEYGLKAMVNLAKAFPEQKNLKTISQEENISIKYLEQLISKLKKSNLIFSTKGKSGGYTLAKKPNQIKVGEIVEILEGPIAPMGCEGKACARDCVSSVVWMKLGEQIKKTLYKIKLSALIHPVK